MPCCYPSGRRMGAPPGLEFASFQGGPIVAVPAPRRRKTRRKFVRTPSRGPGALPKEMRKAGQWWRLSAGNNLVQHLQKTIDALAKSQNEAAAATLLAALTS